MPYSAADRGLHLFINVSQIPAGGAVMDLTGLALSGIGCGFGAGLVLYYLGAIPGLMRDLIN